jgi:hypothetical protein
LLKDRQRLSDAARADLDALVSQAATKRTARAWHYREGLRAILDRKQINVVAAMLKQWCTNVLRSKVEPMKDVARMVRRHFDGIVAWTQTRQTNGFIEALNGLFQAAKRKARLHPLLPHANRALPDCRQARLHPHQPSRRPTPNSIEPNISTRSPNGTPSAMP